MKTLTKPPTDKEASLSLYDPDQLISFASHLQGFLAENGLVTTIQGRPHVKVPGWQYAGTKLGIIPMVEEVLDLSTEKEIRYQTRVALLNIKTNQYVGCGIAVCSNLEPGKKNKPAFAIQSQSQSRAIGKAYRNLLGWVIELAGFEAEEEETNPNLGASLSEPTTDRKDSASDVQNLHITPELKNQPGNQKATVAKRQELLMALNHECISQEERDAMFMKIDSMTVERCEKALAKVNAKIQQYDLDNH